MKKYIALGKRGLYRIAAASSRQGTVPAFHRSYKYGTGAEVKKYIALGSVMLVAAAILVGCGTKTTSAKTNVYGKAIPADMAVTSVKEILANPQAWEGKDVLVAGKITSECPSGGWIWVQDSTGQIYVNMHPTNVFIPQAVGKPVRAMGKVVLESGQPSVVGYGLELK